MASDADAGSATTNRATTYQGRDANFTANISGDSQDKTNAWAFHGQQGDPEEWSRRADINSELEFDARTSLRLRNSARDQRDLKEESIGSFFLNYSNEWEEKRVNDTQVTAGFFDDQLRFVSSYSVSRFSGDDTDGNVETGSQHQQGVAFEPWRSEDVGVVLFSTYGATEAGYQDLSLSSDDKKLQNPFADSSLFADRGFSALRFGGEARFGPGNVTLAQTQSWDETEAGHAKNEYQAGVKFDVTDAAQRFGYAPDGFAEAILPSTLWLDYGLGREVSEDIDGPESRSTDMSLGGAWGWGDVYSEVSYWTSFFDNMKPDERGKDSEEQGVKLALGYAASSWGLDGGVGYSREDDFGQDNRAHETAVKGWLSFSYAPSGNLPSVNATLSAKRQQDVNLSDDTESRSDEWSLITEVDFSQYADDWFDWTSKNAGLGLTMGFQGARDATAGAGFSDRNSNIDIFVGFTGKVGFYD